MNDDGLCIQLIPNGSAAAGIRVIRGFSDEDDGNRLHAGIHTELFTDLVMIR